MIKENKKIKNADDFNGYACEIFENFLLSFTKENKLIRDIKEDDLVEDTWIFVYTVRGIKLAEKMRSLLLRVGEEHFPNEDIVIESYSLYQEL